MNNEIRSNVQKKKRADMKIITYNRLFQGKQIDKSS